MSGQRRGADKLLRLGAVSDYRNNPISELPLKNFIVLTLANIGG